MTAKSYGRLGPHARSREISARRRVYLAAGVVLLQLLAAAFFFGDAIMDLLPGAFAKHEGYHSFELFVALSLLSGVVLGTIVLHQLIGEARQREHIVALAQGALADLIAERFDGWHLTAAEREVALFALKGCDIAEISALRHAAQGTVRAQLSRIYEKAGVASQAMLIGCIVEEFLDVVPST